MPKPRANSTDATMRKVLQKLGEVDERQQRLVDLLTTGDSGSAVAADAYDGLRRQILSATADRIAHLAQLVQLRHTVANASSLEELAKHIDAWMEMADLQTVTDLDHPEGDTFFEVLGGEGNGLELLEPAYVDGRSGRVVRQGRVRRVPGPEVDEVGSDSTLAGEAADDKEAEELA
jgi:hypothetical protein